MIYKYKLSLTNVFNDLCMTFEDSHVRVEIHTNTKQKYQIWPKTIL